MMSKFVFFFIVLTASSCSKTVIEYDDYGRKITELRYKNDKLENLCYFWDYNSNVQRIEHYSKGDLLETNFFYEENIVITRTAPIQESSSFGNFFCIKQYDGQFVEAYMYYPLNAENRKIIGYYDENFTNVKYHGFLKIKTELQSSHELVLENDTIVFENIAFSNFEYVKDSLWTYFNMDGTISEVLNF